MPYDLKDVRLPVLTGRALRAFSALLDRPRVFVDLLA